MTRKYNQRTNSDPTLMFDADAFAADVRAYAGRHCLGSNALAVRAGLAPNLVVNYVYRGETWPTLYVVVALALYCDLSIDKYIRDRRQEPQPRGVLDYKTGKVAFDDRVSECI